MNSNIKYLIENELLNFSIDDYIDVPGDDLIIDQSEIDNYVAHQLIKNNIKLPRFDGSTELLNTLLSYNWEDMYEQNKAHCLSNHITNMITATTNKQYPHDDIMSLFKHVCEKYKWIGDFWDSADYYRNSYTLITQNGNSNVIVSEILKQKEVERVCTFSSRGNILLFEVYSDDSQFYNSSNSIVAPVELFEFLRLFAQAQSKKSNTQNESLTNPIGFQLTDDYADDDSLVLQPEAVDDMVYSSFPKINGSMELIHALEDFNWKKMPKPYRGIYVNDVTTKDGVDKIWNEGIQEFDNTKKSVNKLYTGVSVYKSRNDDTYCIKLTKMTNNEPDHSVPDILIGSLGKKKLCVYDRIQYNNFTNDWKFISTELNRPIELYETVSKYIDFCIKS